MVCSIDVTNLGLGSEVKMYLSSSKQEVKVTTVEFEVFDFVTVSFLAWASWFRTKIDFDPNFNSGSFA